MDQIIKSNLEQDLYKDSMGQAIFHQFNGYMTEWTFKSRNKDVIYAPDVVGEIARQIELYCKLRYTKDELDWIVKTFPWIHKDYVNCFLRLFQPDPSEIFINGVCLALGADKIPSTDYGCGLSIEFKGPWLTTSRYEVPVLAIVNEVYFAKKYGEGKKDFEFQERTVEKFRKLENRDYDIGTFSEFGMRRRYSGKMQDWLVGYMCDLKEKGALPGFVGTSNMFLAKKYGNEQNRIKAVGTMAHEFIMCVGQGNRMFNPAYSNKLMLDAWHREYGTMNGIALTDTIGTDAFLLDFKQLFFVLAVSAKFGRTFVMLLISRSKGFFLGLTDVNESVGMLKKFSEELQLRRRKFFFIRIFGDVCRFFDRKEVAAFVDYLKFHKIPTFLYFIKLYRPKNYMSVNRS